MHLSDERSKNESRNQDDPRFRRAEGALLGAFNELVLDRRYEEIRVHDIIEDAGVGRSTFYEHFTGKDDLLLESMSPLLDALASVAAAGDDSPRLERVLQHIYENRSVARNLFVGPSSQHIGPRIAHSLASRIQEHLEVRAIAGTSVLPRRWIAMHVARGQIALLISWLSGDADCGATQLAEGMRKSAQASIDALFAG
jgi:AcrR family transcriptional regulator